MELWLVAGVGRGSSAEPPQEPSTVPMPGGGEASAEHISFGFSRVADWLERVVVNRSGEYFPRVSMSEVRFAMRPTPEALPAPGAEPVVAPGPVSYEVAVPWSLLAPAHPLVTDSLAINIVTVDSDGGDRRFGMLAPDPGFDTERTAVRRGRLLPIMRRPGSATSTLVVTPSSAVAPVAEPLTARITARQPTAPAPADTAARPRLRLSLLQGATVVARTLVEPEEVSDGIHRAVVRLEPVSTSAPAPTTGHWSLVTGHWSLVTGHRYAPCPRRDPSDSVPPSLCEMKVTFLGTRGEIEARTRRHRMHTSLLVEYRGGRVMIDAGDDWREAVHDLRPRPHAIVITHAHPDHAWGLKDGSPAPVWATDVAWEEMQDYPIPDEDRREVKPRHPFTIREITFEAFPVEHSIRAPAVGYRIRAGRVTVWYAPDLVYIEDRAEALDGCRLYIGDGATMTQSFVRKRGDALIGHTPVRTQLTWCQKEGVPRAIISHCGSEIVEGDERTLGAELRSMAEERGVEAEFAYDGLEIVLR